MMSEKETPQLMFELPRATEGRVGIGALLALGLYFADLIFLLLIDDFFGASLEHGFLAAVLCAPLVQALYIVPMYFVWKRSGKSATAKGLLGGAVALAIIYYGILGLIAFVE
jgi:hypothetical protein